MRVTCNFNENVSAQLAVLGLGKWRGEVVCSQVKCPQGFGDSNPPALRCYSLPFGARTQHNHICSGSHKKNNNKGNLSEHMIMHAATSYTHTRALECRLHPHTAPALLCSKTLRCVVWNVIILMSSRWLKNKCKSSEIKSSSFSGLLDLDENPLTR